MGNKLESIKYALGQGLTGVAKPTKTLEAVDNFVEDVEAWKKNIDDQRLKLKTDTATKVREAEKEAYANLPNTKTERDMVLKGLSNYKDMLFNNMSMVQNGVLKPEDNLIFQENGKQSFEIAADLINNYSTRKEQAMKEASGYYDEEGNFVEPTAGDYQAALQRINDEFMIPGGQEFKFMSNGMGNITMFKTKIDEETKTKVLDLDADGNPIPIDGQSNIPMLAYQNNRNANAPMFVLANEVTKLTRGKNSLMGAAYEEMVVVPGLRGTIYDNMRQSPGFKDTVKQASSSLTNTVPKVVSMLADNGPDAQQTTTLTPSEWDALSDAQKNETISFEYTDFDGSTKKGVKSKYLQVKIATNNSYVAILSERDQLAAEQIAQTALISSLEQTIKPGVKVGDFADRNKDDTDKFQASVDLIDLAATGDTSSLKSLVAENPDIISAYNITGEGENMKLVFIDAGGNKMSPIKLSGLGVDAGKQIAALLQLGSQRYFDKSKLKGTDKQASGTVGRYKTVTKEFGGLGAFNLGISESDGIKRAGTAAEVFANAIESNPEEDEVTGIANTIIQKAIQEYDIDSNIQVRFKDVTGNIFDKYVITVDGVDYESPGQVSKKNHAWLQKNMDRVLRGQKPQAEIDYTNK